MADVDRRPLVDVQLAYQLRGRGLRNFAKVTVILLLTMFSVDLICRSNNFMFRRKI